MEALNFTAKTKTLELCNVPVPTATMPDDVLIKVAYSGICGTDLHIIKGEFPRVSQETVTLGHEFSGTVVEIGCSVKNLKQGDIVAVDPNEGCHRCHYCHSGKPHYCSETLGIKKKAGLYKNGGWAGYSVIPVSQVHKMPESITPEQAALTEPLSCVAHAFDVINPVSVGMEVLVMGAGIIGNLWVCALHLQGHRKVTVSEPNTTRLNILKNLDTGYTLLTPDELTARGKADSNYLFDLIIDCSGCPSAVEHGITLLQRGGTICCFGVAPPDQEVKFKPYDLFAKELKILGSVINPFSFPKAIGMMEAMGDRYLDYDKLGIKTFALKQYKEAIEDLQKGSISKAMFKL